MQVTGCIGQGEHDHLERNNHGKNAKVINNLGEGIIHPGNIPCGHGSAQQNQKSGGKSNENTIASRLVEWIVPECHAINIIIKTDKSLSIGQGKKLCVNCSVRFKRVVQYDNDRHHPDYADNGKNNRQNNFA